MSTKKSNGAGLNRVAEILETLTDQDCRDIAESAKTEYRNRSGIFKADAHDVPLAWTTAVLTKLMHLNLLK